MTLDKIIKYWETELGFAGLYYERKSRTQCLYNGWGKDVHVPKGFSCYILGFPGSTDRNLYIPFRTIDKCIIAP